MGPSPRRLLALACGLGPCGQALWSKRPLELRLRHRPCSPLKVMRTTARQPSACGLAGLERQLQCWAGFSACGPYVDFLDQRRPDTLSSRPGGQPAREACLLARTLLGLPAWTSEMRRRTRSRRALTSLPGAQADPGYSPFGRGSMPSSWRAYANLTGLARRRSAIIPRSAAKPGSVKNRRGGQGVGPGRLPLPHALSPPRTGVQRRCRSGCQRDLSIHKGQRVRRDPRFTAARLEIGADHGHRGPATIGLGSDAADDIAIVVLNPASNRVRRKRWRCGLARGVVGGHLGHGSAADGEGQCGPKVKKASMRERGLPMFYIREGTLPFGLFGPGAACCVVFAIRRTSAGRLAAADQPARAAWVGQAACPAWARCTDRLWM